MEHLLLQGETLSAQVVCRPLSASTGRCQSCPANQQSPHPPHVQASGISSSTVGKGPVESSSHWHRWLPAAFGCEVILRPVRESITIIDLSEALIQLYEQERGNSHCSPRSYAHTRELEGAIQLEVSLHKSKSFPEWDMNYEISVGAAFSLGEFNGEFVLVAKLLMAR